MTQQSLTLILTDFAQLSLGEKTNPPRDTTSGPFCTKIPKFPVSHHDLIGEVHVRPLDPEILHSPPSGESDLWRDEKTSTTAQEPPPSVPISRDLQSRSTIGNSQICTISHSGLIPRRLRHRSTPSSRSFGPEIFTHLLPGGNRSLGKLLQHPHPLQERPDESPLHPRVSSGQYTL